MKTLLFLPLDLLFLTWDAWVIWASKCTYRQYRSDGVQICHFCREWEAGAAPRPIPYRLRKYHCRWLIKKMQPCIHRFEADERKIRCFHDSAEVKYPKWIPLAAFFLPVFWFFLLRWIWGLIF